MLAVLHYEELFSTHRIGEHLLENCVVLGIVERLVGLYEEEQRVFLTQLLYGCIGLFRQSTAVMKKWNANGSDEQQLLQSLSSILPFEEVPAHSFLAFWKLNIHSSLIYVDSPM